MQSETTQNSVIADEELAQFDEFKRLKRIREAEAFLQKLEYDLSSVTLDRDVAKKAIKRANELNIGGLCVLPCFVKTCKSLLSNQKSTAVIALVSHMHGGDAVEVKRYAVKRAVKDGADEVEITAPIYNIKNGNWSLVKREFKKLKRAAKNKALRINVEAALLNSAELSRVCSLAADCGVNIVTLGSGAYGYANDVETVKAVKSAVKDKCLIKVNGVENRVQMQEITEFGAAKAGAKNAVDIAQLIMSFAEKPQ